jgi:hypothetical protein
MTGLLVLLIVAIIVVTVCSISRSKKNSGTSGTPSGNGKSEIPIKPAPIETTNGHSPIRRTIADSRGASIITSHPISKPQINVYDASNQQYPIINKDPLIDYSKEIRVNYDAKSLESNSLCYPFVKVPENGTVIKYPVKGKNARRGMVEGSFCRDFLDKYFRGSVYDNLSLFIGTTPYEPDISYIDCKHKNLFIDIEIDEPYDGVDRKPIHYIELGKSIDDNRNKSFTNRGWMVIRFSEKQIKENPSGCCRFIFDRIKKLDPHFSIPVELDTVKQVNTEKMWKKEEAIQMEKSKLREKYLGIEKINRSETPRNYNIKDYAGGEKIDAKLKEKENPNRTIGAENRNNTSTQITSTLGTASIQTQSNRQPSPNPTQSTTQPTQPKESSTLIRKEPVIQTQPNNLPSTPAPRPYAL